MLLVPGQKLLRILDLLVDMGDRLHFSSVRVSARFKPERRDTRKAHQGVETPLL